MPPATSTLERVPFGAALRPGEDTSFYIQRIGSHALAVGFADFNLGLGVSLETQQRVDSRLWVLGERCPRTADHGRRAGGYAGAIIRTVGGKEFGTNEHVATGRITGGIHDIAKALTDPGTLHRSMGDIEYGPWVESRDMPKLWHHPKDGAEMTMGDPDLPEETPYGIGCHHQYPDFMKPGARLYGMSLETIDQVYRNAPQMRKWVHFLVRSVVAGDIFDAVTSRSNDYLRPGDSVHNYMIERLKPLFPTMWSVALGALQREQVHYLRPMTMQQDDSENAMAA